MATQDRSSLASTLENGPEPQEEIKPEPELKNETKPQQGSPDVLEGGRKAWLSLIGASLALFVSFGWANCIGLFQAEYEENELKNYSQSSISWITSMEFFFMLFMSPVAGRLFDNYGPRLPVAIGSLFHVFGLMMASLSTKYYQFVLSQSVCSGIGASLIFTPSVTAPMTYFRRRRALVGGLTVAGSSLGGVIFPLMVSNLLPEVGFPWTMRACAFLILGLLVIVNLTISSNLEHRPRELKLSQYVRPLREPNFILMCLVTFFLYWGMFIPFDYISTSAIHYGMSSTMAMNLVPILNGASFMGRTIPNILADKFGRFNVMFITLVYCMIIVLALWLPGRSNTTSILFAVFFGIGSGAAIGMAPVLIMGISQMKDVGYRMGTVLSIASIATLTSPPIGAAIVQKTAYGNYTYACFFSGLNFFFAALFLGILRGRIVGWNPTARG